MSGCEEGRGTILRHCCEMARQSLKTQDVIEKLCDHERRMEGVRCYDSSVRLWCWEIRELSIKV